MSAGCGFPTEYIAKSLYRKLWFCFFITIAVTVTALVKTNYYVDTSSDIKRRAVGNIEQILNQAAATLDSHMSNVKNLAWDYFGDKDFQNFVQNMGSDPDAYSHYTSKFSQFLSDNPFVDLIMVSATNDLRLTIGGVANAKSLEADFETLKAAALANDGEGVWLPTHSVDPLTGKPTNTLIFTQAIKQININLGSPTIGVFFFRLSPLYLKRWLGDIAGDEQGDYALVDSDDGQVMISVREDRIGDRLREKDRLFGFSYGTTSKYTYGDDEGVDTLFVSNEINNTSWALVGKIPLNVLLRQVNELAIRTMLIGALCLLGAMLLASLLASRIITPLKQLKNGIVSIGNGNYEVSIPIRSKDEIGYFVKHFNRMAKEINMLIVKVYEADLIKKDAEIRSLQSRINPHFLYNTLGMIDSLAAMHDDDRISMVSSSLAKMFRYNISAGHLSTLQAEIRQLEIYFAIQKIRFADRLSYSIEIEESLNDILTPKLILQPLVENSFIHGIDHMAEGGNIRVRAYSVSDTDAVVKVWNNGPPIDAQKQSELQAMLRQTNYAGNASSSIGLFNVQSRVKLVYGNAYGLSVNSSEEEGTTMTVTVKKMRVEETAHEGHDRR